MNNLNNLSDDELDKLFRQSADESDIEFDEGAWQKMNSLLDEKQPLPTNWRKYSLIILAILFLGSTALYFGNENGLLNSFKNEQNTITINDQNVEKSKENNDELKTSNSEINENAGKEIEKKPEILEEFETQIANNESIEKLEKSSLEKDKLKSISENANQPISKNGDIIIGDNSSKTKNLAQKNKTSSGSEKIESEIISDPSSSISLKNNKAKNAKKLDLNPISKAENKKEKTVEESSEEIGNNDILIEKNSPENTYKFNDNNLKSKNSKTKTNQNVAILDSKNYSKNSKLIKEKSENKFSNLSDNQLFENSNQITDLPVEKTYLQNISLQYLLPNNTFKNKKPTFEVEVNPLEIDLPEPKKVEFYKKGLAIRLAISPDISTISSNKISKIGNNIGGLLEYRFSNKLSIQAGVFRSMKYYDAMPDQYTWVWGYSHDKLVDINATCKMVDFPINIRYDFFAKGPTRIFVGAGATTYKMMNEAYHYNYVDNASPTIKHRDWSGKTGTYYTSNLNLSVGLEKYISKNFTIQVEPFVKSPLKSIGFGKVPLITYGMMISGKYPLNNLIKK